MDSSKQLGDERLISIIIEQLKLPLLHIARQTEQAKYGTEINYIDINSIAEMSIRMIDSYLLTNGHSQQASLDLEPVSLSAALNDAANNLYDLAKTYDCSIELNLSGKFAPVMSQKSKLEAALTMLGYSYLEANVSRPNENNRKTIILSGYKSVKGLVAGVFSSQIEVSNDTFHQAVNNFDSTKQLMPEVSQTTGAGIFIANSIFNDLSTRLRVAHYKRISGMAATLIPSQQLQLV